MNLAAHASSFGRYLRSSEHDDEVATSLRVCAYRATVRLQMLRLRYPAPPRPICMTSHGTPASRRGIGTQCPLGREHFPRLMAAWRDYGASIMNRSTLWCACRPVHAVSIERTSARDGATS